MDALLTMEAEAFAGVSRSRAPLRVFVDLCGFPALFAVFLEPPRVALRSPISVPNTPTQAVVFPGSSGVFPSRSVGPEPAMSKATGIGPVAPAGMSSVP